MENNLLKLCLNDLSCTRGEREVFSKLAFELKYGEALLVTGANGAGKTTLLRLLAGLLPAEQGFAFSDGTALRDDLHFIGAQDGIKSHLTVAENLGFWREMLNGGNIEAALAFWDLGDFKHMPVRVLSSGQRRRLALCRLLIARKKLWLLDEPHAALDEKNQMRLLALLTHHLDEGGLAIIATHDALNLKNTKNLHLSLTAA
jgi:heme exporter protein A